jgi:hypothetical protein
MATETIEGELHVIEVDRKEAGDLIGSLAAQLAGVRLAGHSSGAVASLNIAEHGTVKYRLLLVLESPPVKA